MTQDTWKGNPWQPWTQNLYAYVGNNPVNWIDPTGHSVEEGCYGANVTSCGSGSSGNTGNNAVPQPATPEYDQYMTDKFDKYLEDNAKIAEAAADKAYATAVERCKYAESHDGIGGPAACIGLQYRAEIYQWWMSMVGIRKPWDLKASGSEWADVTFHWHGTLVIARDLGNIHYGYVGQDIVSKSEFVLGGAVNEFLT